MTSTFACTIFQDNVTEHLVNSGQKVVNHIRRVLTQSIRPHNSYRLQGGSKVAMTMKSRCGEYTTAFPQKSRRFTSIAWMVNLHDYITQKPPTYRWANMPDWYVSLTWSCSTGVQLYIGCEATHSCWMIIFKQLRSCTDALPARLVKFGMIQHKRNFHEHA